MKENNVEDELIRLRKLCRFMYLTLGFYGASYNYSDESACTYPDGSRMKGILRDGGADARDAMDVATKLGFSALEIDAFPGPGVPFGGK